MPRKSKKPVRKQTHSPTGKDTLLTGELSPQAIYEPLRHGKDSS